MKSILPVALSTKKTAKKLFLFFAMFSFSITVLAQTPTITSFSPASGPAGTLVTIDGTNLSTPTAFSIGGVAALVVNNNGTVLTGFVMPGAATGAVSIATAGGTATGGSSFTITAVNTQYAQQGSKLVGSGSIGEAQQGYAVSLSADGNTAIVGGPQDNDEVNGNVGAVWIYTRSGGIWSQQGPKLVGTGSIGDATQGFSVSLSADGNTAVVGGYYDNSQQGAAWVFTRSGGVWSQQGQKLVGTGNIGPAEQGWRVSLSADGNTAIIGGPDDDLNGNSYEGAAWIFVRSNGIWAQQGSKIVGTGNIGDAFQGQSVSLSADGNTAIVGGGNDNSNQGAAWIFTRNGSTWTQQGSKLTGTGNIGPAQLGYSVSLSADGNTAIVGGAADNSVGAAWIFTRSSTTWTQQGSKLVGTGGVGTSVQACSVSLSADGNTALVGGCNDNNLQGAAWIFTRSGSTWTQQGSKLVGNGNIGQTQEGISVALSADGNTAIIGGESDNTYQGAAWIFGQALSPSINSFSPASGPVGTLVTINGNNLSAPTALSIGGVTALVINNTGAVITAMVMPGAVTGAVSITTAGGMASAAGNFTVTPTNFPSVQQGAKLVGTGGVGETQQGTSVAVSADGNTAIVGGDDDNSGEGAVWVYVRSGGTWSQQGGKLVGTGGVGTPDQGYSVSLSADGNTALVGGPEDNYVNGVAPGAAWIFTRSGGSWSQQGSKLVGTNNIGANFGTSVSLSADGNTAIIGGDEDNTEQGAAWVFTRSGGTWIQQGSKLVGTGSTGEALQGGSVSLSADGNTAIVGGSNDNNSQGAAWVYTRSGGAWSQQGNKLVGTGNTGAAHLGSSVSLSADGNTALVGGNDDNVIGADSGMGTEPSGAAWVFTRSGGTWSQQGSKLVGTGNAGAAQQGISVSLSADGNTAIVGGDLDNSGQGAVWVYTRGGSTWSQQGGKLVGTGNINAAAQGASVSLSADGSTAMVGGYGDNLNAGAGWVFTVNSPTITSFSPASGPVGTLVTITGTNLGMPTAFSIGGVTALVVNNNGTVLTGYVMPGAITGAVSLTTSGGTITGSGNFAVTATKFPSAQRGGKLVGTGNTGAAFQGQSVAISADGNTAIVGGYEDNNQQGAVWIYTRSGGTWSQQGSKLVGTGGTGVAVLQGWSVAISADGNTAIEGGYSDANEQGAVWVFTRSGGVWSQQGDKLVGTSNDGPAWQGWSVALSADGNTAIEGGPQDDESGSVGATWIFTRSGGVWSQQGSKLIGTGSTTGATQGYSVSLSADGNTALVSGTSDNQEGAVWVFTRSGDTWSQQGGKLFGTGGMGGSEQGTGVSLSADGNTAVVGGDSDNGGQGAIWVYTRSAGVWSQQGSKLVGNGSSTTTGLGKTVSLSADGNTAIVGAYESLGAAGAAWIFKRSGSTWSQPGSVLIGTGATGAGHQGWSVSLSADGTTAISGGFQDNTNQGAAWVFALSSNAYLSHISISSGTLTPVSGTPNYTVNVANTITSVTVTPTTADPTATVTVNGTAVTSGTASGAIPLIVGSNTITIMVTAQDGVTTQPYTITVTRAKSSNALLSTLHISAGTLSPVSGTPNFTSSVGAAATTVTATTAEPNATLTINGVTGTSGVPSAAIPLTMGNNTITVVVTAQDGVTTQSYVITVNRLSNNALLSHISISSGTLTPVSGTPNYTVNVANAITSVTVAPTTTDPNATVKVNGTAVVSGTPSSAIPLNVGSNTITILATAQDGVTTQSYIITVTRAKSTNALLSTLHISAGTLSPVSGTPNFTSTVAAATTTVTATTADPTATVTVNGKTVTSGTASAAIPLNVGSNTITVVVTAQDGVTTQSYIITVTRLSNNALLSHITISSGTLKPVTGSPNYTVSVANAVTSVTITPITSDPNATVTVNGTAVTSGTASTAIPLSVGSNSINIVVTAQDRVTTQPYVITVTRAKSNNALLSHLSISSGTLKPVSGSPNYTVSEANNVTAVAVTPTTTDPNATVTVDGTSVTSGTASTAIALIVGTNTITIVVTAQDGVTNQTYLITVTRASGPLMSLYLPVSVQQTQTVSIENDGVVVHQGVSPNGDGINDFLTIDGLAAYPDNNLMIIDRSGAIIFEAAGYNNIGKVFDGHSSINGRMQQPGTYFYALDYVVNRHNRHKTGFIVLKY